MTRRSVVPLIFAAPALLRAQTAANRIVIDPLRVRANIDRRIWGSFLEHLGRAIYQGIYDPGSALSDASGFRKDVASEVRSMGVPIIRYPGGNFVSGYNWLDGVGPRDKRPTVLDRAWNSIETNQFGTNEFVTWAKSVGAEPLIGTNFGTAAPEMSAALVEYCNVPGGTKWSNLRREHGYTQPHAIRTWCLGNEMDGTWQIGHMPAREYGRKAVDAARQMRAVDPSVQLIACGSSGPGQSTFLEWDREVLEECYSQVDGISLHRYYGNEATGETGGDSLKYLALNLAMEEQIDQVAAVCEYVRKRTGSRKRLWLSFDEWNVWYRRRGGNGQRQQAPHLLEEEYNLEDALLVGGLVNALLRRSDKVRVACLAQLVNVIAPIVTNANGILRQSIYYPYAWALESARGQALDAWVESAAIEGVPAVDSAVTFDNTTGQYCVLLLNRDLAQPREVTLVFRDNAPARTLRFDTLTGSDLKAVNTFAEPNKVKPAALDSPRPSGRMVLQLPARSYSRLMLQAAPV